MISEEFFRRIIEEGVKEQLGIDPEEISISLETAENLRGERTTHILISVNQQGGMI